MKRILLVFCISAILGIFQCKENLASENIAIKEFSRSCVLKHDQGAIIQKVGDDLMFIPWFMLIMGIGIAFIWIMDLVKGKFSGNFFKWVENDQLLWPHLVAEFLTAGSLITGSTGFFLNSDWRISVSLIALGALAYTSLNSLAWAFKEKERLGYAIPMLIGLIGSAISLAILIHYVR
jgi:hypothetical protein